MNKKINFIIFPRGKKLSIAERRNGSWYPYTPLHWGLSSSSHRKEDIHDGEWMGLGKSGWGWPLLCTLIPRQAQRKKTRHGFCPFSALQSCLGRQADASEVLCRLCRFNTGVDRGLLFTLSYYFGLRPGLFADSAGKHRGGVICQQWVACRELSVVLL